MMTRGLQRIALGLSGGVDSAVAAWLLRQAGHEVVGIFMKNWEGDDNDEYCSSRQDFIDAAVAADVLDIELEHVNFAAEYRERVFAQFLQEYRAGRTPNPDVLCNAEIKFKAFLDHAMQCGAEKIATGHYARVQRNSESGQFELLKGVDMHSDIGSAHHYAMSDATGRSVVVEYVENKMVVTETKAVTNHYLCDAKHNVGLIEGDKRYEQLCQRYEQSNGMMSEKEITKAIQSVSQAGNNEGFMGTLWTMVMNLDDHSVTYYSRRHFDKPFHFEMTRKK